MPMPSDPMTQGMPGGVSGTPPAPGGQLATPQDHQEIGQMIEQLKNKQNEVNSNQFVQGNALESQRQQLVMEVFQTMMKAGIDPSNIEQVQTFLTMLSSQSPELYEQFVQAFNSLLGQEGMPQGAMEGTPETTPPVDLTGAAPGGVSGQFPNLAGGLPGGAASVAPAGPGGALGPMPGGMPQ